MKGKDFALDKTPKSSKACKKACQNIHMANGKVFLTVSFRLHLIALITPLRGETLNMPTKQVPRTIPQETVSNIYGTSKRYQKLTNLYFSPLRTKQA